jgi:hypothetical protein
MAIELRSLGTITLTHSQTLTIPKGPVGMRLIYELSDVRWESDRVRAAMIGTAAADWIAIGPDGTGTLDARFTLRTSDSALIFVQITGRVDLRKGPVGASSYFAARFETGDESYSWLNPVLAVGKGTAKEGSVLLELYEPR